MSGDSRANELVDRLLSAVRVTRSQFGRWSLKSRSGQAYRSDRSRGTEDGQPYLRLFSGGQLVWMAVTLVLLFTMGLWSFRLYFIVSFVGLLLNRLLFAPVVTPARWWRVVNVVTWVSFGVLGYLIYARLELPPA